MATQERLLESINRNECFFDLEPLAVNEYVVSSRKFPTLYRGNLSVKENLRIRKVVSLIKNIRIEDVDYEKKIRLKKFLQILFRASKLEEYAHLCIYLFWKECWEWGYEPPIFQESYIECVSGNMDTDFSKFIVDKLHRSHVYVDIVGYSNDTFYLIEVKRQNVDDRSIGQIMRYYETARRIVSREHHGCDIRRVTPILIAQGCSLSHWASIPRHFREFLELYFFDQTKPEIILEDGKKILETHDKEKHFNWVL